MLFEFPDQMLRHTSSTEYTPKSLRVYLETSNWLKVDLALTYKYAASFTPYLLCTVAQGYQCPSVQLMPLNYLLDTEEATASPLVQKRVFLNW